MKPETIQSLTIDELKKELNKNEIIQDYLLKRGTNDEEINENLRLINKRISEIE